MFKLKQKGFSLVELMVVIVIVGVITLVAAPSYYQSIKKAKYEDSITQIVSLIKDARNTALVGKFTGTVGSYSTPKGGYGVHIQKTTTGGVITSFQDANQDQLYDPTNDTKLSEYIFPEVITIQTMSGTQATNYTASPVTNDDITEFVALFIPPSGDSILNENVANKELTNFFIILKRYDGLKSKRLKINKISGFIESD